MLTSSPLQPLPPPPIVSHRVSSCLIVSNQGNSCGPCPSRH
jgi:hypothetical protein